MLGLATHEAHFYILREVISYGRRTPNAHVAAAAAAAAAATAAAAAQSGGTGSNASTLGQKRRAGEVLTSGKAGFNPNAICQKDFQLVHIAGLREYLEVYLRPQQCPFPFEVDRAVDDFVFMCFFVGNDFLPHLPSLSIHDGAINMLMELYKMALPSFGGYLTENGVPNLARTEELLKLVASREDGILRRRRQRELMQKARRRQQQQARVQRQQQLKRTLDLQHVQVGSESGVHTYGCVCVCVCVQSCGCAYICVCIRV
jgi:5'-3' exoribonuclease 2